MMRYSLSAWQAVSAASWVSNRSRRGRLPCENDLVEGEVVEVLDQLGVCRREGGDPVPKELVVVVTRGFCDAHEGQILSLASVSVDAAAAYSASVMCSPQVAGSWPSASSTTPLIAKWVM